LPRAEQMIRGYPNKPSVSPHRLPKHPAARAWNRLYSKSVEPNFIEFLYEAEKSSVYRLNGVGPGGTAVIAKICTAQSAQVEQIIYKEILPQLPISSLTFYGCVDEPATEYLWFFLEDAGGEEFAYSIEEHRRLAARWLGQMHVSAACLPAVSRLPDRGPKHYLHHLRSSRELIQRSLGDPALNCQALQVLEAIVSQCNFLESRWDCVEQLCNRFPRTLVHCDLGTQNFRVRSSTYGINLVAFDWEMAGYGIPAPDIAELSGRGVPRQCVDSNLLGTELVDYWSVVQESWSDLDPAAIKELADLGTVMRSVLAISWQSLDIRTGWWPIEDLHSYQVDLAVALEQLDFVR
jgi:Ser/Thr protein kinase RdoA (MazF antagonist)